MKYRVREYTQASGEKTYRVEEGGSIVGYTSTGVYCGPDKEEAVKRMEAIAGRQVVSCRTVAEK